MKKLQKRGKKDFCVLMDMIKAYTELTFEYEEDFIYLLKFLGNNKSIEKLTGIYFGNDEIKISYVIEGGEGIVVVMDFKVYQKWLGIIGKGEC